MSGQHDKAICLSAIESTSFSLEYLGEGAANVAYRIIPSVTSTNYDAESHSNCWILRLRKNLAFTRSSKSTVQDFETRIRPEFKNHQSLLVSQQLFELRPEVLVNANNILHSMESNSKSPSRPENRRGAYHPLLSVESYGILMPNLHHNPNRRLLEFKPKWLVQSPSAPNDAKRCRTCALNEYRRSKGTSKNRKGDAGFCPFDLLSDDSTILTTALINIWSNKDSLTEFTTSFQHRVQPVLLHIQSLQDKFNNVSLDSFRQTRSIISDLDIAMAVRDCSVFLELREEANTVEITDVKIIDLDLKSPDNGKLEHWAAMEEDLISSGAYTGHLNCPTVCSFSR